MHSAGSIFRRRHRPLPEAIYVACYAWMAVNDLAGSKHRIGLLNSWTIVELLRLVRLVMLF